VPLAIKNLHLTSADFLYHPGGSSQPSIPSYAPLVTLIYASNRAGDRVRRCEYGSKIMVPHRPEIADR
jgi:hypothetical protein